MKKYAKFLIAAAVAALAVMAIGATSASAKICSTAASTHTPTTLCASPHGEVFDGVVKATATSTNPAQLTSGFVNVKCTHSELVMDVTGTTTTGEVTTLDFTGCTNNLGQNCTAATSASSTNKWPAKARTGTAPNGFMEVENVTGEFTCGSTTCRYKASKVGGSNELVVTGGAPAKVTIASALPVKLEREEVSSGLCSSTASWHGTYTVTAPSSLYLT